MAYEELDNYVPGINLGGLNKKTGKPNPTQIEGYYLRQESRPDKFNPSTPQAFYVFLTPEGELGVYGKKAGIRTAMKKATPGVMTKLVATDEVLDTGKGNPMKVFKIYGDKNNTIDLTNYTSASVSTEYQDMEDTSGDVEEDDVLPPPPAPKAPVTPRSPASIQQTRAFLKSRSG